MPTAHEVATDLRAIADRLEENPDLVMPRIELGRYFGEDTEAFKKFVAFMPRPITKEFLGNSAYDSVFARHAMSAIDLRAQVYRGSICRIVKPAIPAVYECGSFLSDEELDQVSA